MRHQTVSPVPGLICPSPNCLTGPDLICPSPEARDNGWSPPETARRKLQRHLPAQQASPSPWHLSRGISGALQQVGIGGHLRQGMVTSLGDMRP